MELTVFDGRVFNGIYNKAVKAVNLITQETDKINKKYCKIVYNGLETIAHTHIGDFYAGYSPHVYNRTESLMNAFKITATQDEWSIELGPQYMTAGHRQGNEFVYWLVMSVGVHGGFPHNGDYYWRYPNPGVAAKVGIPAYSFWFGYPAPYGEEDIEGKIADEANTFIDEKRQEAQNEFDSKVVPVLQDILNSIQSI